MELVFSVLGRYITPAAARKTSRVCVHGGCRETYRKSMHNIQVRKSKTVLIYYFFTSCSKEFCLSSYFEKKLHLFWIRAQIFVLSSGR